MCANVSVVWKWSNGYLQEVKRNKFYREDLICWAFLLQALFNWKGGGGNLKKYDFQLKTVRKGWTEHSVFILLLLDLNIWQNNQQKTIRAIARKAVLARGLKIGHNIICNVNQLMSSYSSTFVNIYFWYYKIKNPSSSNLWIPKVICSTFFPQYVYRKNTLDFLEFDSLKKIRTKNML